MRFVRLARCAWLWWGEWFAVQVALQPCFSLGVHVDLRARYVDLHLPCVIVSVGRHPERTKACEAARWTSRGMLVL